MTNLKKENTDDKLSFVDNEIPVISLAGIDDEVNGRRGDIKKKIVKACEVWGIFQVVDHGVDAKLVSDMIHLAKQFFDMPSQEKLCFDMSSGKKGGYLATTHVKGDAIRDSREIVTFFTYPIKSRDYSLWPDKPEGWATMTMEYSEKLMGLASKLLAVLSEAMGLDKEAIEKACLEMNQKIVANFYPKIGDSNDVAQGLQRHTDTGTITILLQDHVCGLQATKDGGESWVDVEPLEGAFVIDIGDHGHYLSNGRYKSGDHQVVASSNSSRVSIVSFHNPKAEAIVYPLKVSEEDKPMLEERITFGEMYTRVISKELPLLLAISNKSDQGTQK
ncbi:naringenin,2-oxoglutarate 3-dioxygenase-like [Momordica charantia]|uniref:Naringenin,2-oxoglutarate 3-dioxygenase n=1 Tax=Momordica charantia TaxID=3673 RepID=A0A6J1DUW5_MOMCH|nr:naringenin,2-oxoglutarate 3-dioxygenase-like [Momordica charantia]